MIATIYINEFNFFVCVPVDKKKGNNLLPPPSPHPPINCNLNHFKSGEFCSETLIIEDVPCPFTI